MTLIVAKCAATPLLIQEGWLRHQQKGGEANLSAADGVVAKAKRFVMPDHPVRSINGGFAASLLMSRPPLLYQEGSWPTPTLFMLESSTAEQVNLP